MTRRKNPSEFDAILAAATANDDLIIWWDTSAGKMYSITKSEFLTMVTAGSGDMSTSTYDPASIAEQLVGLTAAQTITNKTIDADNNTVSNIGDEELKAGIDAAKIADASVSNTEFQYLNGVTSAIQTQIDGKADSSHTHTLTDITDSGALAALDTVGTAEIDNDAVTFDKISNIATNRVLARSSAGSGSVEALTLPNFRTLINVEDGADVTDTTNVTAAGALMDSEVTDLAGIKSLDTSTLQVKPTEGAFVDGDKTKLDGIETGATADQTAAEIKTAYESNLDTNVFTDAEQTKLAGIETGADVTDETNVVSALSGATLTDAGTPQATDKVLVQDSSDSDNLKYVDFSDFSSGTTVDVVSNVAQDRILGRVTAGSGDSEELTATQVRTLINVEDGATADQTGAEIKAAYEGEADTNAFTDAEQSKLSGIEASADVTDTANVTAAGALMDSELTDLAGIKSLDTSTLQVKPSEGAFVDGDKTKLDGIETGADVTDETNVVSALSGATLSDAGTPQATDKVLVQDASDSDNLKYVDFSDFSSGTTVDVVSNVAADRILGRVTAGSGDSEELTAAQVRSLINVEDGADVTDTTNVTAAGALMDSEVTDLAGIKALDTSTLQVKPAEGAFVDGDKTKLDGIETGADVTDTANVTAAGALMDSEVDADIKTLSLPANTTISTFGASLVDDADASAARTTLGISTASKTAEGLVELATTAEIDTGTDTTRAMPIDQFVASKRNIEWIVFDCVDPDTDCAVGTNIAGDFVSPIAGTILQSDSSPFYLYATNSTAGAPTGTMVVDVNINGTTIMTTNKLDFDATEKTTTTAATPPDLTTTSLAVGDIITIDIDSVHVTPAKGLKVYMGIRQ
jgi:hypothetical protein